MLIISASTGCTGYGKDNLDEVEWEQQRTKTKTDNEKIIEVEGAKLDELCSNLYGLMNRAIDIESAGSSGNDFRIKFINHTNAYVKYVEVNCSIYDELGGFWGYEDFEFDAVDKSEVIPPNSQLTVNYTLRNKYSRIKNTFKIKKDRITKISLGASLDTFRNIEACGERPNSEHVFLQGPIQPKASNILREEYEYLISDKERELVFLKNVID
jgi:hypothetical protein